MTSLINTTVPTMPVTSIPPKDPQSVDENVDKNQPAKDTTATTKTEFGVDSDDPLKLHSAGLVRHGMKSMVALGTNAVPVMDGTTPEGPRHYHAAANFGKNAAVVATAAVPTLPTLHPPGYLPPSLYKAPGGDNARCQSAAAEPELQAEGAASLATSVAHDLSSCTREVQHASFVEIMQSQETQENARKIGNRVLKDMKKPIPKGAPVVLQGYVHKATVAGAVSMMEQYVIMAALEKFFGHVKSGFVKFETKRSTEGKLIFAEHPQYAAYKEKLDEVVHDYESADRLGTKMQVGVHSAALHQASATHAIEKA